MLESQATITGYTLWRIFLFQKEAVSQVSVTNSKTHFSHLMNLKATDLAADEFHEICSWLLHPTANAISLS